MKKNFPPPPFESKKRKAKGVSLIIEKRKKIEKKFGSVFMIQRGAGGKKISLIKGNTRTDLVAFSLEKHGLYSLGFLGEFPGDRGFFSAGPSSITNE